MKTSNFYIKTQINNKKKTRSDDILKKMWTMLVYVCHYKLSGIVHRVNDKRNDM